VRACAWRGAAAAREAGGARGGVTVRVRDLVRAERCRNSRSWPAERALAAIATALAGCGELGRRDGCTYNGWRYSPEAATQSADRRSACCLLAAVE